MPNSQKNVIEMRARRLTHNGIGNSVIEEVMVKPLQPDEILIETSYSGISRGTERLVFYGRVPDSEWDRMRCPHQVGNFSFPVTYGYACVGIVKAKGNAVTNVQEGQTVFVLHPHQNRFIVQSQWANPLPPDLDPSIAVLTANMETALNAIWDAELNSGHKVAVIGAGVVGLLTAHLLRSTMGISPVIVDTNERRHTVAEKIGGQFCKPGDLANSRTLEFDRVFNTSASGEGLQLAIDASGFEAKIIEMSWYGDHQINLHLGGAFHSRRLQIISSQVGHVSPAQRGKLSHTDRLRIAMQHLADENLASLLKPRVSFSELAQRMNSILDPDTDALCPLVTYMNN